MFLSLPISFPILLQRAVALSSDTDDFRNGFTLIEVLIAMTLASLVLLTLTASGGYVLREWSKKKNSLDDSLEQTLFSLRLERALSGAYPHACRDRKKKMGKKKIFFEGDEHQISWVSTVTFGPLPGLAAWRLNQQENAVSLSVLPGITGDPTERLEKSEPIATWPGWTLDIQYLEEKDNRGLAPERTWRTVWQAEKERSLPVAVMIRLENKDNFSFIPLIIPIKANQHETITPRSVHGPSPGQSIQQTNSPF